MCLVAFLQHSINTLLFTWFFLRQIKKYSMHSSISFQYLNIFNKERII